MGRDLQEQTEITEIQKLAGRRRDLTADYADERRWKRHDIFHLHKKSCQDCRNVTDRGRELRIITEIEGM
jgi:hypothetical protein